MSEAAADGLAHAVRLFNEGDYLEAHEAFEELWEAGHGPEDDLFKGLLQAAIALHHFREGNLPGARKLYRGHRRYLAPYLPSHGGLDLAAFLADMQAFLKPVLAAGEDEAVAFVHDERPRLRARDPA